MKRVLVVENDPDQLELRRLILEGEGYEVRPAGSAAEAMPLIDAGVDAAVVDLRVPKLGDGLRLIRRLGESSAGSRIIVLSGWTEVLRGLPEAEMASAILSKPAPAARLLRALEGRPADHAD